MSLSINSAAQVSVIMPAYNASRYIQESIHSVLSQVDISVEVIVCDDASSDETVDIVRRMMQGDSRIKLLINETNRGPSFSRNKAIMEASGEWIALLDADDFYSLNRLKNLIEITEQNQLDIVADNIIYVDSDGKNPVVAIREEKSGCILRTLKTAEFIENDFPSKEGFKYGYLKPVIRRSFILNKNVRYDENVRLGEDFIFYIECLLKGALFAVTLEGYYCYRVVEKSLSRTGDNAKYLELFNNNLKLINMARGAGENKIVKLLEKRQKDYENLIFYNDLVRLVKERFLYAAIKKILSNPCVLPFCFSMVNRYLKRQIK
jgi:succinoglycan biosynthesis protein ExoO